jgi:hypothetical protein
VTVGAAFSGTGGWPNPPKTVIPTGEARPFLFSFVLFTLSAHQREKGERAAPRSGEISLRFLPEKLSHVTRRSAKNLMRMLGPSGNPQARNLFQIVAYLQEAEGVRLEPRPTRAALRTKRRKSLPH